MVETQLIEIKEPHFEAVVPWVYATNPFLFMSMAQKNKPTIESFAIACVALRAVLAPEKIERFDELNIMEMADVVNFWLAQSMELSEKLAKENKPPKKHFWQRKHKNGNS